MFKLNLVIAVGFLFLLTEVRGDCKVCGTDSKVACLNQTHFDVCFLNSSTLSRSGIIGSCKTGQVCTTQAGICKDAADSVTADCGTKCNECGDMFACISKTQFTLCDNKKPTNLVITCPEKKVCDITSTELCATCQNEPTCSNDVVKKPDPAVDYPDTCTGINSTETGYYLNIYDATCKTYVFCQEYNGEMVSLLYTCSSGYFDSKKMKCVATKPTGCE